MRKEKEKEEGAVTFAVIADIHGNLPALLAIKEDLERRGADRVLVAGDMITDCPDSDEILDLIRHAGWTVIKGNREQYFLDHRAGLKDHWTHARQMSAMMWTFDRLSRKNRKYLETLEHQAVLEAGGLTIRMVHGSPYSPSELIFPVEEKERFGEIMDNLREDILICGHSHIQWDMESGDKLALNPGSAGVHFNREHRAEYALLIIENGKPSTELLRVPYSLEDLERRFFDSGLYEASPHWSRAVLNSLEKGENFPMQMVEYAMELMEKEGITDALTVPDKIWDRACEEFLNRV